MKFKQTPQNCKEIYSLIWNLRKVNAMRAENPSAYYTVK